MSSYINWDGRDQSADMNWFCFHHAGGTAQLYQKWSDNLPKHMALHAYELPGRGHRFNELHIEDWGQLVSDACNDIRYKLEEKPYVFVGFSIGASIMFELIRYLLKIGHSALPEYIYIIGRTSPIAPKEQPVHQLVDHDFIEYLKLKGGMDTQILQDENLVSLLLPRLRADYRLNAIYDTDLNVKISIPIKVFIGDNEGKPDEHFSSWQNFTSAPFAIKKFPGNHFFIEQHYKQIIQMICHDLQRTSRY